MKRFFQYGLAAMFSTALFACSIGPTSEGKDATDEVEEDSDGADDVMYDETQIDVGPKPPQTCGPRQRWCAVCEECWPIDLHCNPYCQQ